MVKDAVRRVDLAARRVEVDADFLEEALPGARGMTRERGGGSGD
jgi:hypothetical protein